MNHQENGPPLRDQEWAGHDDSVPTKYAPFRLSGQRRPWCEWYGIHIVEDFPAGCPLKADNALAAVHLYQQRAYRRLHHHRDLAGGLADLQRAELCGGCVARLLAHPKVQRIREAHRSQAHAA